MLLAESMSEYYRTNQLTAIADQQISWHIIAVFFDYGVNAGAARMLMSIIVRASWSCRLASGVCGGGG